MATIPSGKSLPSSDSNPQTNQQSGVQSLVVWVVWGALAVAGISVIGRFAIRMPYADEWGFFGAVIGDQSVTLDWLWAQHNEHRLFLPRLLYLGLGRLTGFDFLAPQLFDMALLSLAAAALIMVARRYRGRTELTDAVFPLVLMQWGQVDNLIWGFQLGFVIPAALGALVLAIVLSARPGLGLGRATLAFVLLIACGLCGANGVVLLPPMAGWFVWAALIDRSGSGWAKAVRRIGLLLLAALLLAYTAFYFHGFVRPAHHGAPPGLWAVVRTTLEVLALSLGPNVKELWPVSAMAVPLAVVAAIVALAVAFRRDPSERVRTVGFLAAMSGIVLLAAGIGWGRSFFGPGGGLAIRYVTLTAPIWCVVYLIAMVYLSGKLRRRTEQVLMLVVLAGSIAGMHKGWRVAAETLAPMASLAADAQAGLSDQALAVRYADRLAFDGEVALANRLYLLRKHRLGPFRGAAPPAVQPIHVQRLKPIAHPPIAPLRRDLTAGESFCQMFTVSTPGKLERIDVELCRFSRRWPEQLTWVLWRVTQTGDLTEIVRGKYPSTLLRHDEYISLRFATETIRSANTFVLELRVDRSDVGKRIEVPLYRAPVGLEEPQSLAGFAFVRRD